MVRLKTYFRVFRVKFRSFGGYSRILSSPEVKFSSSGHFGSLSLPEVKIQFVEFWEAACLRQVISAHSRILGSLEVIFNRSFEGIRENLDHLRSTFALSAFWIFNFSNSLEIRGPTVPTWSKNFKSSLTMVKIWPFKRSFEPYLRSFEAILLRYRLKSDIKENQNGKIQYFVCLIVHLRTNSKSQCI